MDDSNDFDADALRTLAEGGSDMTKPMPIDFAVAAPNEQAARAIAQAATALGYVVSVSPDEDEDEDETEDEDEDDAPPEDEDEDETEDETEDEDGEETEDDGVAWTCNCRRSLVATFETIRAAQLELNALAEPHGGYADGWGTFGNKRSV